MPALQGTWPRDFLSSLLHRIPSSSLDEQSPAKQHWHVAAGLQTTSSAETSPAVITAGEISMGRRATLRPAARPGALQRFARHQLPLCTHCLHQISPTPLPFPLSNSWSLFSTRLSKEEKKCRSAAKHWCTYRLLAHPSKPKLAELPAITARPLTNSEHQRSSVEPNKPGNFNASSRPWPCFWSAGLHLSSRLDASSATSPPPIHAGPCLGQRPAPELKTRSLY